MLQGYECCLIVNDRINLVCMHFSRLNYKLQMIHDLYKYWNLIYRERSISLQNSFMSSIGCEISTFYGNIKWIINFHMVLHYPSCLIFGQPCESWYGGVNSFITVGVTTLVTQQLMSLCLFVCFPTILLLCFNSEI